MAYGNDTDLIAYAATRGVTLTGDPASLREGASDYLDGVYYYQYKGEAVSINAAWPRSGVTGVSDTEVPDRVERATYEAALLLDGDAGALSSGGVSNNGSGAVASEKVDVISVSYHAPNSGSMSGDTVIDNTARYSSVENILRPLLKRYYGADAAVFVV